MVNTLKVVFFIGTITFSISVKSQNSLPSSGNIGIKTTSPFKALQIGNFGSGEDDNQLLIPGTYNFEQVRLGQIGNGNSALEFVNHIASTNSYGIRFLVNTDYGARGLQIQYAGSSLSYSALTYQTGFYMNPEGGIGINTTAVPAGYRLSIAGNMIAESVTVKLKSAWPDYVFSSKYKLPSLQTIEKQILLNGHLPGLPSASEVQSKGLDLGEMNAKLLEKIEESTLYLIEQNKKIEHLIIQVNSLKMKINKIRKASGVKK